MFDQNDGNLDASIEHILNEDSKEKETVGKPEGSSLVDDPEKEKDKEDPAEPKPEIDAKTQELIDEMLAEEA